MNLNEQLTYLMYNGTVTDRLLVWTGFIILGTIFVLALAWAVGILLRENY
jgi:hypothetical protein